MSTRTMSTEISRDKMRWIWIEQDAIAAFFAEDDPELVLRSMIKEDVAMQLQCSNQQFVPLIPSRQV